MKGSASTSPNLIARVERPDRLIDRIVPVFRILTAVKFDQKSFDDRLMLACKDRSQWFVHRLCFKLRPAGRYREWLYLTFDNADPRSSRDRCDRIFYRPRARTVRLSTFDRQRERLDFDNTDAAAGRRQRRYRLIYISRIRR
jgi:hypothetical protein